jgi:hypothetical protein
MVARCRAVSSCKTTYCVSLLAGRPRRAAPRASSWCADTQLEFRGELCPQALDLRFPVALARIVPAGRIEYTVVREDHSSLNVVLQLADIPGPRMFDQHSHGFLGDDLDGFVHG